MKKQFVLFSGTGLIFVVYAIHCLAQMNDHNLKKSKAANPLTASMKTLGAEVYKNRCSFCHGDSGRGDGPLADYLNPRPRNLTQNLYKFRTTLTEELPTDEDLYRTIYLGIPGTSMPSWGKGKIKLGERELWAVIYHIKSFDSDFSDAALDANKNLLKIPLVRPRRNARLLRRGEALFKSEAGCFKCHGMSGRGNGPEALGQKDNAGFPILPTDLTQGWKYKNWGNSPEHIYRTLSTGLNGTPMPGYYNALSEEDRWAVAYYVNSLIQHTTGPAAPLIISNYANGRLPDDPKDPRWMQAQEYSVSLSGQLIAKPRLLNPSVDHLMVRSFFNDEQISFLLVWHDRIKNVFHEEPPEFGPEKFADTYVRVDYEKLTLGNCRDAVALQFPVGAVDRIQKPYFFLGQRGSPVNLWWWKSDWQENIGKHAGTGVEQINAEGGDNSIIPQPPQSQETRSSAVYEDGLWRVVLTRALRNRDHRNDVQFNAGILIPIAFHVWDGANGELGLLRSISSWYYLWLEPPRPLSRYLPVIFSALLVAAVEWLVIRFRR